MIVYAISACMPLTGCGGDHAGTNSSEALECAKSHQNLDEYNSTIACLPLSKRRTFRGVWTLGFEVSELRESTQPSRKLDVIASDDLRKRYLPPPGQVETYEVVFDGREAEFKMDGPVIVLMDRPVSIKQVNRQFQ